MPSPTPLSVKILFRPSLRKKRLRPPHLLSPETSLTAKTPPSFHEVSQPDPDIAWTFLLHSIRHGASYTRFFFFRPFPLLSVLCPNHFNSGISNHLVMSIFEATRIEVVSYARSEMVWENEHAIGVVSAKAQNAGATRAAARLCKADGGRNGR